MNKKKLKFNFGKMFLCLVLAVTILITQYSSSNAYTTKVTTNYLAIQANKTDLKKNAVVNGYCEERDKEDYSSAVFYLLTSNCDVVDSIDATGDYIVEKPMYCSGNVNLKVNDYIGDNFFAANKNVTINCTDLTSSECSLIYSKSGNITINCDALNFNGVICAPNGNITIKSDSVNISGCVMAKKVTIKADNTEITPTKDSSELSSFMKNYKNEGYMLFDAYVEEGNLCVYCEPNLEMSKGIVYVRNKGEKKFTNIGEFETFEGSIENFDFEEQVDIIVQGKTIFGEDILSDVVTLAKDAEGEIYCVQQDSDNDDVADGLEIYYLKTDPSVADTDRDGVADGIEAYNLCTSPKLPNETSNDFDRDGVTNLDEVRNKTDAFLSDTDFDGKKDDVDDAPRGYKKEAKSEYVPTKSIGSFDIIITSIDEDGNCVQKLFDFINEKVKLERTGDLVTSYCYDYDMNLSTKVTSYDGEIQTNHYEYENDTLTAIYNNGYKYGFNYDESGILTEVTLNDKIFIKYEYSEDCDSVLYANGDLYYKTVSENKVDLTTTDNGGYTYTYDTANKIETYSFADSGLTVSYVYDEADSLKKVETNTGFTISYDTSKSDNEIINNITYTIDSETYTQKDRIAYSEEGDRIISSTLMNGATITKYFESDTTIIEKLTTDDNSYFKRITYEENGMPASIRYGDGITEEYIYNSDDVITKLKEEDIVTNKYEYDVFNRLTSAINYKNGTVDLFEYDLYDNIKSVKTYTYNEEVGEIISEDTYEYSETYADQLLKFNGESITYDESGKPLTYYDGSIFTWDGDKLTSAMRNGKKLSFVHNAEGTVMRKTVDGVDTTYSVEGQDYIAETTNGKTIIYMYDAEANVSGFTYEGKTYYYVKNALNDVIRIVNSANEFVCSYNYDAWGNILSVEGDNDIASLNKFRYRSYYYDTDMEMYYLRSRYYDSQMRRFISTDEIEQMIYNEDNLNLYAYCKCNPVYYSDPEGTAVRVAIITLSCWENESGNIMDDFQKYYGANNVLGVQHNVDNMDELEESWNGLTSRGIVVINTHANPWILGCGKSKPTAADQLTIAEINELDYKAISVLILLGCNAGHQDYSQNNVAEAFSGRISGKVVASDGTVYSSWNSFYYPIDVGFTSKEDNTFKELCLEERTSVGWLVYISERNVKLLNTKFVTIASIMDYLKSMSTTNSGK